MGEQVSVQMPEGLKEEIDTKRGEMGYSTRSEFIRDAARERLQRDGF